MRAAKDNKYSNQTFCTFYIHIVNITNHWPWLMFSKYDAYCMVCQQLKKLGWKRKWLQKTYTQTNRVHWERKMFFCLCLFQSLWRCSTFERRQLCPCKWTATLFPQLIAPRLGVWVFVFSYPFDLDGAYLMSSTGFNNPQQPLCDHLTSVLC